MVEHVDPEVLALVSLGETADDATLLHLEQCQRCRDEVAELAGVVATARTVSPADALVPAPGGVWAGVRSELGLSPDLEPGGHATRATAPGAEAPATARGGGVPLTRSRTGGRWLAAAAVAGVVVGGAGGAWWAGSTRDTPAEPVVVARATLDPLPGRDAFGEATVEEGPDGSRILVVSLESAEDDDGYREVWLIDRDVTRLVSLGVLEGSQGRFTVPAGVDLGDFPVVDLSEEPLDGDPAHSGDSIIRGILDT